MKSTSNPSQKFQPIPKFVQTPLGPIRVEIRFESIDNYVDKKGFVIVSSNNTEIGGAALRALGTKHKEIGSIDWRNVPMAVRAYKGSKWWCTPDESFGATKWLEKYEDHTSTIDMKLPFFPHIRIQKTLAGAQQSFSHIMRVNMIPQGMWPAKQLQIAMHETFRVIFSCVSAIENKEGIKFTSIGMTMLGCRQNYTPEMFGTELLNAVNGLNVLWPLKIYYVFSGETPADKQYQQLEKTLRHTIQTQQFLADEPILRIAISACKRKLECKNNSFRPKNTIESVEVLKNLLTEIVDKNSVDIPYQRLTSAASEVVLKFLLDQPDVTKDQEECLNSPHKEVSHAKIQGMIFGNKIKPKRADFQLSCLYHIIRMAFDCNQPTPINVPNPSLEEDDRLLVLNTSVLLTMIPTMLDATLPDEKDNQ